MHTARDDANHVEAQLTRGSRGRRVLWVNTIPAKVRERARAGPEEPRAPGTVACGIIDRRAACFPCDVQ